MHNTSSRMKLCNNSKKNRLLALACVCEWVQWMHGVRPNPCVTSEGLGAGLTLTWPVSCPPLPASPSPLTLSIGKRLKRRRILTLTGCSLPMRWPSTRSWVAGSGGRHRSLEGGEGTWRRKGRWWTWNSGASFWRRQRVAAGVLWVLDGGGTACNSGISKLGQHVGEKEFAREKGGLRWCWSGSHSSLHVDGGRPKDLAGDRVF